MSRKTHSKYIRHHRTDPLIRYWAATILLRGDLKTHLMFGHVSDVLLSVFKHCPLSEAEREDAEAVRDWIETEQKRCDRPVFDESDIFSANTAGIAKAMGLDAVELGILRFACLLNSHKALGQASEICGDNFTETDMCELLAELLHKPFDAVYKALHPSSLLRESGLVRPHGHWMNCRGLDNWLGTPPILASQVFRAQQDDHVLMDIFYRQAPRSTLTQHDFHQRTELALMKDYLRASFRSGAPGTNILLWGRPGTGKTEMARHLAQSLRKRALEVNTVDLEGAALTAAHRLDCYRFCQAVIGRSKHSLVIFDEVEEILCDDSFARMGFQGENRFTKGLMNNVLETNRTPAIWITNTVDGVDPAYLRRFDLVVQLTTPVPSLKKRMARRVFRDLPMEPELVDQIVQNRNITPAHMQKVTKICQRLGLESEEQTRVVVNQVLNGDLRAVRAEPLKAREKKRKAPPKLPYRPDLINCDADTDRLAECLDGDSSVRMCLFGPPGTGKTAWAEYLAGRIRRTLVVKHAADILDKYVGGTEQNIASVFEEASRTGSILMLDEVDSFLPDRSLASRHWEVTQANQFLTAMERFDGILICTTNLMDSLDPATLRRFDFKIHFDYLTVEQVLEMTRMLIAASVDRGDGCRTVNLTAPLKGLRLTPGDFSTIHRRYSVLGGKAGVRDILEDLRKEAEFRNSVSGNSIGFTADIR